MKRYYLITWKDNRKNIERTSKITLSKPTGMIEVDGPQALNLFTANFGNLIKNSIIKIREFDENDNQIGEDITPQEGTATIPIKKG